MQSGIKPVDVLPIYNQALDAVQPAHLLNVCHRDLKPENFLYDKATNTLVLADFGIARFQEEDLQTVIKTGPHDRLANFAYAAPEQRFPDQPVDSRADTYALGLILNELFTGKVPQGSGYRLVAAVAPDFGYVDDLVESMIQQDPSKRPRGISDIKDILIGRKQGFVEQQKLDQLKRAVVPITEVDDPLIRDPIAPVQVEDYRNGALVVRLSGTPTETWKSAFRTMSSFSWSTLMHPKFVDFQDTFAYVKTSGHHAQEALDFLKQYCNTTNREYREKVESEHRKALQHRRQELEAQIRQQEEKSELLKKLRI